MNISPAAVELHRNSLVIDGLNVSRWSDEEVNRHLHEGGVTAINATVAVWEGTKQTLQNIGRFYQDFDKFRRFIRPVTRITDIHDAKWENRVGIIFGFQNASPIEDDLNLVEVFYRLGSGSSRLLTTTLIMSGRDATNATTSGSASSGSISSRR